MLYLSHDTFLCNQMFPFANVIAVALANRMTVIYPRFRKHATAFPYFRNALCQFPAGAPIAGAWRLLPANKCVERWFLRLNHRTGLFPHILMAPDQAYFFDDVRNADGNRRLFGAKLAVLDGLYFVSHEHFVDAGETLRTVFAPSEAIRKNVNACIARARRDTDVLVGVHLRFGDYLSFKPDMAYDVDEYHAVMRELSALFHGRRTTFLLSSDRPQDPARFPGVRAEVSTGRYVEDLYCLSQCDLIVGPPSTFSQWASWFGGVPLYVINYKNQVKYNVPVTKPREDQFVLHVSGFGRHAVQRPAPVQPGPGYARKTL